MLNFTQGQIRLADGEAILEPDGVEFRHNGNTLDPNNLPTNTWVDVILVNPDGGWFYVTTTTNKPTKIRLHSKSGEVKDFEIKK